MRRHLFIELLGMCQRTMNHVINHFGRLTIDAIDLTINQLGAGEVLDVVVLQRNQVFLSELSV